MESYDRAVALLQTNFSYIFRLSDESYDRAVALLQTYFFQAVKRILRKRRGITTNLLF